MIFCYGEDELAVIMSSIVDSGRDLLEHRIGIFDFHIQCIKYNNEYEMFPKLLSSNDGLIKVAALIHWSHHGG